MISGTASAVANQPAEAILQWVGLTLQVCGVIVAIYGFRRGWREVRISEPFSKLLTAATRNTRRLWRRITRRKPEMVTGSINVTIPGPTASIGGAFGRMNPREGESLEEQVERLREFVNREIEYLARRAADINSRLRELDSTVRTRTVNIEQQVAKAAETARQRSIRAIKIEASGFAVLTVGSLLQGIGSIVGLA